MTSHSHAADDDFRVGPRQQTAWGTHMATAFAFGEAGAGLYLVSQFYEFALGMIVALAMVLFGKGGGHFTHLGQPFRGWRAFAKVNSSWVSRGLLAIVVFVAFGSLQVLHVLYGVLPQPLAVLTATVAVAACALIMVYQGFAMSHSSAITLWSSGLMPVISLIYALLSGVLLTLVLGYGAPFLAEHPETLRLLQVGAVGLLVFALVTVLGMLHAAWYGSEGGRESVNLLLRSEYAAWFAPLVLGLGIVVPGALLLYAPQTYGALLVAAAAQLIGFYAFRVLVFKAGTYDPAVTRRRYLR